MHVVDSGRVHLRLVWHVPLVLTSLKVMEIDLYWEDHSTFWYTISVGVLRKLIHTKQTWMSCNCLIWNISSSADVKVRLSYSIEDVRFQTSVPHDGQSAKTFYQDIMSFTCGGSSILIILLVLLMWSTDKKEKTSSPTSDDASEKTCLFHKIQSGTVTMRQWGPHQDYHMCASGESGVISILSWFNWFDVGLD